jgi:hypothetical protein
MDEAVGLAVEDKQLASSAQNSGHWPTQKKSFKGFIYKQPQTCYATQSQTFFKTFLLLFVGLVTFARSDI